MRALLRENITATMEDNDQEDITNPRVAEMQYFENLFETEKTDARMNYSQPVPGIVDNPDKSAYLYWVDGTPGIEAADKAVGPSIALRVNAGDKFDIETWARFENKTSYTGFDLAMLASLLGNTFASIQGFEGYSVAETSQSLLGAFNAVGLSNGTDNTIPYAYLNYVVYDKDMVPIAGDRVCVSEDAGFDPGGEGTPNNRSHKRLSFSAPVEFAQDGYIYVWVSNQSENTNVWFDDLKVTHTQYIVTHATDYGVWGDVLREQKSDETKYRFGYQGQYAERDDETGWNHFELREYDPVIGRWMQKDPEGQYYSPYVGMGNNPLSGVDPDGGINKNPPPNFNNVCGECKGTMLPEITVIGLRQFGLEKSIEPLHNGIDVWELVSLPSPSFLQRANNIALGVANPIVDISTTLWTSIANGFSQAYYGSEFNTGYDKWYPYKLETDWRFHKNTEDVSSEKRKKEIILNTVNVNATVVNFGIKFNVSPNTVVNGLANFAIKTPAKTAVVKGVEKSLDHVHNVHE